MKRMKRCSSRPLYIATCLVLTAFLAGCNELELKSNWRDRDIVIDGDAREWSGLTTYVEKGNIAVGVTNDDENLFLCFHSPTREVAGQIVMHGLTVWFDPEGGSDKDLGIHCPIGVQGMPPYHEMSQDRRKMKDMIQERIAEAASRVEILGPENQVHGDFPVMDIPGIQVAVAYTDGRIVYELKLPLNTTDETPYALAVNWDKKVGLGLVTPEIDMEAMREAMGSRTPPEDIGGPGGMMPGDGVPGGGGMPGGGRGGGMHRGMPQPVEIWCRVELTPAGS